AEARACRLGRQPVAAAAQGGRNQHAEAAARHAQGSLQRSAAGSQSRLNDNHGQAGGEQGRLQRAGRRARCRHGTSEIAASPWGWRGLWGTRGKQDGESVVNRDDSRQVAARGRRHQDRTTGARRGAGGGWLIGRRPLVTLAAIALAGTATFVAPIGAGEAQAQRLLQVSGAKRTMSIAVAVGKTEDIRIDTAFTDGTHGAAQVWGG